MDSPRRTASRPLNARSRIVATASGGSSAAISASVQRATSRPRDAAEQREHDRLDEQLANQLRRLAPMRQPHRHLGGASRPAHEQQIGDVRAGDEQHDARHAERAASTASSPPGAPALAAAPRASVDRLARNRAIVCSLIPFCSGASTSLMIGDTRVDAGACLLDRDAWLEPREQVDPVAADGSRSRSNRGTISRAS